MIWYVGIYFDPPTLGIVMEYCPNGNLRELLRYTHIPDHLEPYLFD
jgi:serine/threonine protein kinase